MTRLPLPAGAAAALTLLTACSGGDTVSRAQLAPEPPPQTQAADGSCWAHEITPAVYEQVMGEVQVVQAEIAPDGTVIRPPIYRRAPVPRVVQPRGEIRFEAPCAAMLTPEFIGSVQRALAARGYFRGPVTGRFDAATTAAIRSFQSERGLDSGQLSLETARTLGLVAVARGAG
ncbi:peptidoglycan-binding domain-containing protein [Aestuariicoccus sp. MJ-SS9]|uniref:peptidoglycan-binding domain-containing protein n=1 Tax=Aestuariicoccus sp. MJ-SS9 TaxID=3079855 RepID=UPI0029148398|nr:peptidoglycan-binding domain-containing protein [Aestuariicoccus sp. MJ-SS9]MDU8913145.1 peptidoglycan-binding domain-containing protein [Aestuariicoccus sp. MJ-SS9]